MKNLIQKVLLAVVILGLVFAPASFATSISSNPATVNLSLSIPESISVTATPGNITFTYNGTSATASGPISTTLTVNVAGTRSSVAEYVFFSTSNALTNGNINIPANEVYAQINGGGMDACGQSTPVSSFSCDPVGVWNNLSGNNGQFSSTNSVTLSMQSLSANLNAGTYSGVINFVGVAN